MQVTQRANDFASIAVDLALVAIFCRRLLTERDGERRDEVVALALWTSATVLYVRCFESGRRAWLPRSTIEDLGAERLAVHEAITTARNHAVAHAVDLNDRIPVIERAVRQSDNVVLAAQVSLDRRYLPDVALIEALAGLASAVELVVRQQLAEMLGVPEVNVLLGRPVIWT
jgi:hypothetical protein